jgi:large subunit ribosomal protein L6e
MYEYSSIALLQVDEKFNDVYFKKEKLTGAKPEASFFADPKNKEPHPEAKVADQKSLDKSVIEAIKKSGPAMGKYLAASFSLSSGDRPHAMRF